MFQARGKLFLPFKFILSVHIAFLFVALILLKRLSLFLARSKVAPKQRFSLCHPHPLMPPSGYTTSDPDMLIHMSIIALELQ
jgi:hypothetical protein